MNSISLTRRAAAHRLPARIAALLAVGLLTWAGNASARTAHVARGDGICPAGQQPVSPATARADAARMCGALGTWYIARLAGGGSMDGPGYGCTIRPYDGRDLGHTLCAPVTRRPAPRTAPDVYRPGRPDVYRPSPRPDVYRPRQADRLRSGQRIALRSVHGRFLVADPSGRVDANRIRRAAWETFTLLADGAVRDGERVRLRTAHDQFVSATRDGRALARKGRDARKARWTLESADGQRWLSCGDRVHLRSTGGRYLVAEADGRANADRRRPASWETFTVLCL